MKVVKEFTWDMAHMLEGHAGLCKNIHGHTYKMQVQLECKNLVSGGSSKGMVMDFKHLKEIVKEQIVDYFDHAFVASEESALEMKYANLFLKEDMKVMILPERSTAENMSKWIYRRLQETFVQDNSLPAGIEVQVTLWETPTSYAIYGGEDE